MKIYSSCEPNHRRQPDSNIELTSNAQSAEFSLSQRMHISGRGAEGMSVRTTFAGTSVGYFACRVISESMSDMEPGCMDGRMDGRAVEHIAHMCYISSVQYSSCDLWRRRTVVAAQC